MVDSYGKSRFKTFVDDVETTVINNFNYSFYDCGSSETNHIGDNSLSSKCLR